MYGAWEELSKLFGGVQHKGVEESIHLLKRTLVSKRERISRLDATLTRKFTSPKVKFDVYIFMFFGVAHLNGSSHSQMNQSNYIYSLYAICYP